MNGRLGAAALLLLVAAACAPGPAAEAPPAPPEENQGLLESPSWESLRAVLWVQTAPEYRALALQTYRGAERFLDAVLADSSFTAAREQERGFGDLPPAVILDVDETVLDNSPYQARLILTGETYDPESWGLWVEEAAAEPVPGAVAFTRAAAARGVTVFYVTNRRAHLEDATRRNLERHGFPFADGRDVLLHRGEREDWGGDKSSRRTWVAERYRIVMLVGDDFNDFVSGVRDVTPAERDRVLAAEAAEFGRGWYVLPNPMYGSWEGALLEGEGELTAETRRRTLLDRLDPERKGRGLFRPPARGPSPPVPRAPPD